MSRTNAVLHTHVRLGHGLQICDRVLLLTLLHASPSPLFRHERYPPPAKVKEEIVQMIKGLCAAVFCPAASLYLAQQGLSKAYCGSGGNSVTYNIASFFVAWYVCSCF